MKLTLAIAGAIALAVATPAAAQNSPGGIVQIYHVAPGHQVDFLKWLDQQDKIAASAGVPAGKLYAHMDGDSWDYLVIAPVTTPAQDAALDAAAVQEFDIEIELDAPLIVQCLVHADSSLPVVR